MGVLMAWVAAIGLQTVRDVKYGDPPHAPLPSEYVASGMWFGALALLDGVARPVGSLIAWGTILALFFQVETAASSTGHPFTDLVSNGAPAPTGSLFPDTSSGGGGSTNNGSKNNGYVPASVRGAQQR